LNGTPNKPDSVSIFKVVALKRTNIMVKLVAKALTRDPTAKSEVDTRTNYKVLALLFRARS
jgi:hypothetical protein